MSIEIKDFISQDNYKLLVETAEDIGNALGMVPSRQTKSYFRIANIALKQAKRNLQTIPLELLKPKTAYLITRSYGAERAALEKLHFSILDAVDCVIDSDKNDFVNRLNRLSEFIEAIYLYQQYASIGGARHQTSLEDRGLRNKISQLQNEMNRLYQFINASAENAKVFLSHAHKDKEFVEELRRDLEDRGITTWYSDKDLDIGDILSDAISHGIEQSWFFLIIVSPNSICSNWVKYELDEAYDDQIAQRKKILPVLYGNLRDEEIPQRLKKHLYADFRDINNYEKVFEKLYRAIIRGSSKNIGQKNDLADYL